MEDDELAVGGRVAVHLEVADAQRGRALEGDPGVLRRLAAGAAVREQVRPQNVEVGMHEHTLRGGPPS
jgi:hypothetical protein